MKDRFVLPTFRSECSDLLQGEDETSMRHLSLYSLASHQVLSPALSEGSTGKVSIGRACMDEPPSNQVGGSLSD